METLAFDYPSMIEQLGLGGATLWLAWQNYQINKKLVCMVETMQKQVERGVTSEKRRTSR